MRQNLTFVMLLLCTALPACGTRGPLVLPPPQKSTAAPASVATPPTPTHANTETPQ